MAKKYDVVAVTGEYQKDGETKKRYRNVGMINENAEGHLSLHLDHLVTVDDDGKPVSWFGLFEPRSNQAQGSECPKCNQSPCVCF